MIKLGATLLEKVRKGVHSFFPFFAGGSFSESGSSSAHEIDYKMFLKGFEDMKRPSGAFIAAPSADYEAVWIRDHLYCTFAYYYLGDNKRFLGGIRLIFDLFKKYEHRIEAGMVSSASHENGSYNSIHAKFHADTLDEITHEWGHHQLDAIGLFLYLVGFAHRNGITVARTDDDKKLLEFLVSYLIGVRYWELPDNGMWEEGIDLHASSIGAVYAGLTLVADQGLAIVPISVIMKGHDTLYKLLPNESPSRDADMALLSLLWPHNVVTAPLRKEILERVKEKLVQTNGLNRYWGDNYYRSASGVSAEWPMGFFWLSIIAAQDGDKESARQWFEQGVSATTADGLIPELYQDGKPNNHTPLAWAHAIGIIAAKNLNY